MNIKLKEIPRMTIQEFADQHGLTMEVHERDCPIGSKSRYFAYFEDSDTKDGCILIGSFGNGATPEHAIANYASEIEMKRLVIGANTKERREIDVPRLIF